MFKINGIRRRKKEKLRRKSSHVTDAIGTVNVFLFTIKSIGMPLIVAIGGFSEVYLIKKIINPQTNALIILLCILAEECGNFYSISFLSDIFKWESAVEDRLELFVMLR